MIKFFYHRMTIGIEEISTRLDYGRRLYEDEWLEHGDEKICHCNAGVSRNRSDSTSQFLCQCNGDGESAPAEPSGCGKPECGGASYEGVCGL